MTSELSTSPVLADSVSPEPAASSIPSSMGLPRFLTALPVYNEQTHVFNVLSEVRKYAKDILVVDDGSTDGTTHALAQCPWAQVVRHPQNLGYGAALQTAFQYAREQQYEILLTIDCDGQHEPQRIGQLVEACRGRDSAAGGIAPTSSPVLENSASGERGADIVSGSRYLVVDDSTGPPPEARQQINQQITREINQLLGLRLTDAFCGFKAYRVEALAQLHLTETGYAMPLELWVQAAYHGLRIIERPVPLVYLDEKRSFGGSLDDATVRLEHYHAVIERSIRNCVDRCGKIDNRTAPADTSGGETAPPSLAQAPKKQVSHPSLQAASSQSNLGKSSAETFCQAVGGRYKHGM